MKVHKLPCGCRVDERDRTVTSCPACQAEWERCHRIALEHYEKTKREEMTT